MSGINKFIGIGRLGKTPEIKYTESNIAVASCSIAISETYKNKNTGERKENTEWVNLTFWKGQAEVASKYVKKGDMIYVEGKLKTRSWEKDGIKRYATEVHVDVLQLLPVNGGKQEQAKQPNAETDSLPF